MSLLQVSFVFNICCVFSSRFFPRHHDSLIPSLSRKMKRSNTLREKRKETPDTCSAFQFSLGLCVHLFFVFFGVTFLQLFSDDLQGTGAVVLAAVLSALRIFGLKDVTEGLAQQRIVVLGAGSAGAGIADAFLYPLIHELHMSEQEAAQHVWMLDSKGLLGNTTQVEQLLPAQRRYRRNDLPRFDALVFRFFLHVTNSLCDSSFSFQQAQFETSGRSCQADGSLFSSCCDSHSSECLFFFFAHTCWSLSDFDWCEWESWFFYSTHYSSEFLNPPSILFLLAPASASLSCCFSFCFLICDIDSFPCLFPVLPRPRILLRSRCFIFILVPCCFFELPDI